MKKALYITSLAAVFLFGAEPSAFKAGDLDAPNPYGLTSSEKKIVEQNKNIQSISRNLFDTAQSQQELRNEIDGMKSLLVGHSEKIKKFETKLEGDDKDSLKTLNKKLDDNLKLQNENYEKIMKTLTALAALVDDTRGNYVSKEQLKTILGKKYKIDTKPSKVDTKPVEEEKAVDTNSTKESPKVAEPEKAEVKADDNKTVEKQPTKQNSDELLKKAKRLHADGKLKEAKTVFEEIAKNDHAYQTGLVAFYIAEIDYKNSNYKAALEQYQKSIEADEKASYVPTILFHTAVCLEKLNDKEGAKKILSSLIANNPKHYLVASAKKRLAELK